MSAARQLLIRDGPPGVTMHAVAREVGITAAGLYRYVSGRDELLAHLARDCYHDLAATLQQACSTGDEIGPAGRLLAIARQLRTWAVGHPQEFALIFGVPLAADRRPSCPEQAAALRVTAILLSAGADLWRERPFEVPDPTGLPPTLIEQLTGFLTAIGPVVETAEQLPPAAMHRLLLAWVQLYGLVTMEVFGHLRFCLTDSDDFFEVQLQAIARPLGVTLSAPAGHG